MVLTLTACGSKNEGSTVQTSFTAEDSTKTEGTSVAEETNVAEGSKAENKQEGTQESNNNDSAADNSNKEEGKLLQSASVDLDGDGTNEKVEAVQIKNKNGETQGKLKIVGTSGESENIFCTKASDTAGILTSMEFEDLDGDGSKDVFIIIPDNGASFSFSTYFIYSMKTNKSFAFSIDNELNDFISNFHFKYNNGNKLAIVNDQLGFSADLSIELDNEQSQEDSMKDYEMRAWIEQVPVNISESSMISIVNSNGAKEIKIPLPIFGVATVDMIGELDLYYRFNESFTPVLEHFEVLDLNNNEMIKVGSFDIK